MTPPSQRHACFPIVAAVLALAGVVTGCYAPSIQDGSLACADGKRCPRGFECRDGICRNTTDAPQDVRDAASQDVRDAALDEARDAPPEDVRDAAPDEARDAAAESARPDTRDAPPETHTTDGGSEPIGSDGGSEPTGRGLGSACEAGADCASGFCADRVCCQSACAGRCEACNLPDAAGVCAPVAAGTASPTGHPTCPTDTAESCDRDGTCDGNRGCRLRRAGMACGTPSCSAGMATAAPTCDGLGQCVASTPTACAPYACDGNTACFVSCRSSADCQAPNSCTAGSCGPKSNGASCSQASECASQHCVDGLCCNEACADRCRACDLGASRGTCAQVTSGQPHGARAACAGTGTCAGSCSAASATACTYPGDDITCRSASCAGATLTARAGCNGAGSCATPATSSCGDLVCNPSGTACLSICTSDNHCATTARPYCDGGACVSGRANGARCQAAPECASQRCVDGFCCNDACQLPCQACDVAGHAGVCWPVASGTPYGGRASCGGTDVCAGYCNGMQSGQCFFPGSETTCMCALIGGTCNGGGTCRTIGGLCL